MLIDKRNKPCYALPASAAEGLPTSNIRLQHSHVYATAKSNTAGQAQAGHRQNAYPDSEPHPADDRRTAATVARAVLCCDPSTRARSGAGFLLAIPFILAFLAIARRQPAPERRGCLS
jgi:cell division protein FtsN